ncbi:MAG: Y-family DNA polymerase [Alphaproteobacteria bacterium]|nr:Y-family DNA polymerase [Alphaproteobacteria bacterium]
MYGLLDCNNFFVSCERAFNPSLNGKAVGVLSSNDGCVVARSNELKALGVKMGTPMYQIKNLIDRGEVTVLSSNYTLYGDMSARVMRVLQENAKNLEIYSIDEAFFDVGTNEHSEAYVRKLAKTVTKSTGIPVSIGVAETKTLAKIANHFAKKYKKYNQVCLMETPEKREKALRLTPIGDVWGVGRKSIEKMRFEGIFTAYDFMQKNRAWVRKNFMLTGERVWQELNGEPCVDLVPKKSKKQICTSRSFGEMVEDLETLSQAVSSFASDCAYKLRSQKSCANAVMVFIYTNRFRTDLPQYMQSKIIPFSVATSDTLEIVNASLYALKKIFMSGFKYKKAGVVVMDVVSESTVQQNLFDVKNRRKAENLMKVIDKINDDYRYGVVKLAVQGVEENWKLRRENLSPNYTTKLSEIIKVKI